MPVWTRTEAAELIKAIVPVAQCSHIGVALAGSLAHQESSDNDLDLLFFRLKSTQGPPILCHSKLLQELKSLGIVTRAALQFEDDDKLVYWAEYQGRKVDLFFPYLSFKYHDTSFKVISVRTRPSSPIIGGDVSDSLPQMEADGGGTHAVDPNPQVDAVVREANGGHYDWRTSSPNSIFVFGSNLAGRHGKGAAKEALNWWGAVYGEHVGHHGRYALPTKDAYLQTLSLPVIDMYVKKFIAYAEANPQLQFLVTRIGCGLAGYTDQQISPMFKNAPANCVLPPGWRH